MQDFIFFFKQGLSHISDVNAYDHILFIVALAALHSLNNWRALFWMVTAFTVGHSLALALATFQIVEANSSLIEFLIPMSIIFTASWNIVRVLRAYKAGDASRQNSLDIPAVNPIQTLNIERSSLLYGVIILFGLIHGLGFSNYLQLILARGESLAFPLFSFNLGLEIGQILILFIALVINFVFLDLARLSFRIWAILVSLMVLFLSLPLAVDTGQALLENWQ